MMMPGFNLNNLGAPQGGNGMPTQGTMARPTGQPMGMPTQGTMAQPFQMPGRQPIQGQQFGLQAPMNPWQPGGGMPQQVPLAPHPVAPIGPAQPIQGQWGQPQMGQPQGMPNMMQLMQLRHAMSPQY